MRAFLAIAAVAVLLSACADLGDIFRRTAANTVGEACRSMSNCYTNRRDALADPKPWERGTSAKPHHDPFRGPAP